MTYSGWQKLIYDLISLAREQISLARLARQEAIFAEDMRDLMGIAPWDDEMIPTLHKSAKLMRCKARETLKLAEIENGKRFLRGEGTVLLKEWLDGRNFRKWLEYKKVYADSFHLEEA